MKKIKITTLPTVSELNNTDKMLGLGSVLKLVEKSNVSGFSKKRYVVAAGTEIDTNSRRTGLIGVINANSGHIGLYLQATGAFIVLVSSTDTVFQAGIDAATGISIYQKATLGNLFIKNNTGNSVTIDITFY